MVVKLKFLPTLFILIFSPAVFSEILGEYTRVNPYSLPGDSENNHLSLPGLRIHEANDYWGQTDKYVSGVGSLALTGVWRHYSTSLTYKGRFLQPALETRNDQPEISPPLGVYAEWAEVMWNQSVTIYSRTSWALKLDGGIGYNDLGDHGFVNVYRKIHEVVASPIKDDKFGKKLKDNFLSTSIGAFIIIPLSKSFQLMAGHSAYNSKVFVEHALETSVVLSVSKNFAMSAKYMSIKQTRSEFYEGLRNHRQQAILALRLFGFWTPSLMYVGPIFKSDKYPQWYLSPLSLTYPF